MKRKPIWIILACLLVLPLCASAQTDRETPSSQDYTYIRLRYNGYNVFYNRATLANAGYTQKAGLVVTGMQSDILGDVADAGDDYGGILLIEGHGVIDTQGHYYLVGEVYPNTTAGLSGAIDRADFLMGGASYSQGDLQVAYCSEIEGGAWGVCLTEQGISSTFSGSNGLVILASCYGSKAFGKFGGTRLTISWDGVVDGNVLWGEVNTLFANLTGANGVAFMPTENAINGTMKTSGKSMAIVPFIAGVTKPSCTLTDTLNTITWAFGVKMKWTGRPYVGGAAVLRQYYWPDDYTLVCKFYCGWSADSVIVGLDADLLQSNKGIHLLADDVHHFYCSLSGYPPAASVASFIACLGSSGGVTISAELEWWRGPEALWVVDDQGVLVGDTVRVSDLETGKFEVFDSVGSLASRYTLLEREIRGVFVRADADVLVQKPQVIPYPEITFDPAVLEKELETRVMTGLEVQTSYIGLIIVPSGWTWIAQALADWHTAHGHPTKVVSLSVCGSTRESIRAYIESFYAQGGRYVLLGAGACDEKFNDPTWWPNGWRWWYDYYHELGYVAPGPNYIPTFFSPDTAYVNPNMSYNRPYSTSDYPYAEHLVGMRVARFPVHSLVEFQVLVAKTLTYLDHVSSNPYANKVSFWVYAHNLDGNSGLTAEVLADQVSGLIPSSYQQFKLYNESWTYSQAEGYTLDDWAAGRGYIIMSGTSSTGHKMIQTWAKIAGWYIGKLPYSDAYYPFVWGASCNIGSFDSYVNPSRGTIVARDLMTADPYRGTPLLIAPTGGTWIEGNYEMMYWLTYYAFSGTAMDAGTLFMLAQSHLLGGPQDMLARSYNLYGDPMAPLPGQSATTGVGDLVPQFKNSLCQNHPNPFNPVTTIMYSLKDRGKVSLRIYNVAGQIVSDLVDEIQEPGFHRVVWDGQNGSGKAASGIYFCQIQTCSFKQTIKMVLLR